MLAFNRRLKVGLWDVGDSQRRLALTFAKAGLSGDLGSTNFQDGAVLNVLICALPRLNLLVQLPTPTNRTGS